ncbi:hypothetical protein [Deinococcus aquiradiocola]|nr:hypothetical protein [Deinococcus aquiradiocola]
MKSKMIHMKAATTMATAGMTASFRSTFPLSFGLLPPGLARWAGARLTRMLT